MANELYNYLRARQKSSVSMTNPGKQDSVSWSGISPLRSMMPQFRAVNFKQKLSISSPAMTLTTADSLDSLVINTRRKYQDSRSLLHLQLPEKDKAHSSIEGDEGFPLPVASNVSSETEGVPEYTGQMGSFGSGSVIPPMEIPSLSKQDMQSGPSDFEKRIMAERERKEAEARKARQPLRVFSRTEEIKSTPSSEKSSGVQRSFQQSVRQEKKRLTEDSKGSKSSEFSEEYLQPDRQSWPEMAVEDILQDVSLTNKGTGIGIPLVARRVDPAEHVKETSAVQREIGAAAKPQENLKDFVSRSDVVPTISEETDSILDQVIDDKDSDENKKPSVIPDRKSSEPVIDIIRSAKPVGPVHNKLKAKSSNLQANQTAPSITATRSKPFAQMDHVLTAKPIRESAVQKKIVSQIRTDRSSSHVTHAQVAPLSFAQPAVVQRVDRSDEHSPAPAKVTSKLPSRANERAEGENRDWNEIMKIIPRTFSREDQFFQAKSDVQEDRQLETQLDIPEPLHKTSAQTDRSGDARGFVEPEHHTMDGSLSVAQPFNGNRNENVESVYSGRQVRTKQDGFASYRQGESVVQREARQNGDDISFPIYGLAKMEIRSDLWNKNDKIETARLLHKQDYSDLQVFPLPKKPFDQGESQEDGVLAHIDSSLLKEKSIADRNLTAASISTKENSGSAITYPHTDRTDSTQTQTNSCTGITNSFETPTESFDGQNSSSEASVVQREMTDVEGMSGGAKEWTSEKLSNAGEGIKEVFGLDTDAEAKRGEEDTADEYAEHEVTPEELDALAEELLPRIKRIISYEAERSSLYG